MSTLFSPLSLGNCLLRNRVWLSAMCQYAAVGRKGLPTDWHAVHLGSRAAGGFGLIVTEATAVTPEGRISFFDTGLWDNQQVDAWQRVVEAVHSCGGRIAVQLAHAGRKGSLWPHLRSHPSGPTPIEQGGWTPVAPSPIKYSDYHAPATLTSRGIYSVIRAFASAAKRAVDVGFDGVEVHAGHGYLIHQFLSPLSNRRTDEWGGVLGNRMRLLLLVVDAVRGELPLDMPLLVRISATDWLPGGWDLHSSEELAQRLKEGGVDLLDVSSGGLAPASIPYGKGYQVPFSRHLRESVGMRTGTVGLISDPVHASSVVENGDADVVFIGRAALRNPYWPQFAALELNESLEGIVPEPYWPRTPDVRFPSERPFICSS